MIIEQIAIKGFLSYRDKQVINFPETSVCLVNGSIDFDTSLSNGSGKSGLFEAIPVNLFGKIGGRAEVLDAYINDKMEDLYIQLIFKIDDNRYKSVFSKRQRASTKHEIFYDNINKKLNDAKWKITDRTIEEILGLSFSTYNSTIYLNERDSLKFIDGSSGDRKEILRELLNAKVFEQSAKKANKKADDLEREIELNINLVENKQNQIKEEDHYHELLEDLKEKNIDIQTIVDKNKKEIDNFEKKKRTVELKIEKQKEIENQIESEHDRKEEYEEQIENKSDKIEKINNDINVIKKRTKEVKDSLNEINNKKEDIEKSIEGLDKDGLKEKINKLLKEVEKKNSLLKEKEKESTEIGIEIKQYKKLIEKIDNFGNICPITEDECPIVDDSYKGKFKNEKQLKLGELDNQFQQLNNEIFVIEESLSNLNKKNEKYLEQVEEIDRKSNKIIQLESDGKNYKFENKQIIKQFSTLEEDKLEFTSEVSDLEKKVEKSKTKITELLDRIEKGLHTKLEEIEDQIDEIEVELKTNENKIKENENEITVYKSKLKQIEEIKGYIKEIIQRNEGLTKKKKVFLILTNIFGKEGIQKAMIKQIIPFLEKSSSELLKVFNNDSEKIKIKFDLDPKRADGELKKGGGLDILVLEEDKSPKDLRMYSGGERIRLIFSIILGLARLLSKRSGKKHETLIIDEKIAKLDRKGIDQFAEVIEIITKWYKRIFIITHIETLKDLFNQIEILVNKTEEEGSIVTINEG